MAMGAPARISGEPRTVAPYGLFTVVTPRQAADPHWQNGAEWEVPPCRELGVIGDPTCDPSDSTGTPGLPKDFDDSGPGAADASPFTVYAPFECSPVGNSPDDAQAVASALLLSQEQYSVEHALWTGAVGNEPNLTQADPADPAAADPLLALATLENEYRLKYGLAGTIHMSPWAATILTKTADLNISGSTARTPLGTPVVIGSGYGDPNPNRLVITPPLFVYRSEVITSSNRAGDLFDRASNDLYAIAERTYLVGWDDCPTPLYVDINYHPAA